MGTWQPPPRAARRARSAVTAAVGRRVIQLPAGQEAPSDRVSIASAPWPTAGHTISGGRISAMRSSHPSRFNPAAASTMASYWPSSSLRRRVSRLPRTDSISQIRPQLAQLRGAPQRTGAQLGARRQIRQPLAHHGVARIFALGHGGQHQALGQLRGQIFQAVDGQVGAAIQQRFFDFLGEQALARPLAPAARR